ncbi:MAG TPA: hypothetical protein VK035_02565 [Kiloniellales bacterium]|nr:hypothetical protein [Kiloniellales bacterium]
MDSSREEARRRFRGFVHMTAGGRKFLSRAEEKRLLEEGVTRFDLEAEEARGILLSVMDEEDFVLERELDRRIAVVLHYEAGKRRRIDRKRFSRISKLYGKLSNGAVSESQARHNVKRVMEEEDIRPARSGPFASRRWFRRVENRQRRMSPVEA